MSKRRNWSAEECCGWCWRGSCRPVPAGRDPTRWNRRAARSLENAGMAESQSGYQGLISCYNAAQKAGLMNRLNSPGNRFSIGGPLYLAALYEEAPCAANDLAYAASIPQHAMRLHLIQLAGDRNEKARTTRSSQTASQPR